MNSIQTAGLFFSALTLLSTYQADCIGFRVPLLGDSAAVRINNGPRSGISTSTTPLTATATPPTTTTTPPTTTPLVCGNTYCGYLYRRNNETVRSPRYPCPYPRNESTECYQIIQAPPRNTIIRMTVIDMTYNCVDEVYINDGATGNLLATSSLSCIIPIGTVMYTTGNTAIVTLIISTDVPAPSSAGFEILAEFIPRSSAG